jgi:hypothetical protein
MLRDVLEGRLNLPARVAPDRTVPGIAALEGVDILTSPGDLGGPVEGRGPPSAEARTVVMPAGSAPLPMPAVQGAPAAPPAARPALSQRQLLAVLGALVGLNILAWWWFTRADETPAAVAAAGAAPAPAAAASTAPPPATMPPAASAPAAAGPAATEPVETVLSVLPARVPKPAADAGAAATPAIAGTAAVTPTTPLRSTDVPAVPPRAAAAGVEVLGPRARCGDRNFLLLLVCMKRECDAPELANHPECVKMREQEQASQRPGR